MVKSAVNDDEIMSLTSHVGVDLRRDEASAEQVLVAAPDPEVTTKGKRRYMTAAYKARVLRQADACTKPGEVGSLLRREGLYSSHLTTWRRNRDEGLDPKKRGRKVDLDTETRHENGKLRREIERLNTRIQHAELIIDVQKKVAALLGNTIPPIPTLDETR